MDKKYVFLFPIILGFISAFFSCFAYPGQGGFDWPFMIIIIIYLVVASIFEVLIVLSISNRNPKVVQARLNLNDSFQELEDTRKWEDYKDFFIFNNKIFSLYEAYCLYAYKDKSHLFKRKSTLTKEEFKDFFLRKRLSIAIAREKIGLIKKHKIRILELKQDDASCVDLTRIKFKRGVYIGKSSLNEVKQIFSVLFQIVSLGIGIYSIYRFNIKIERALLYKISIILILFISYVMYAVSLIKEEISYWEELSQTIKKKTDVVMNRQDNYIYKTLAYNYFFPDITIQKNNK